MKLGISNETLVQGQDVEPDWVLYIPMGSTHKYHECPVHVLVVARHFR